MIKNKKAQMIVFSILIALFVFVLVLTFFFESLISKPIMDDDKTKLLEREATRLSDSLLLPGYPENWHETNPQKIGLLTNGSINENKLKNLSNLASEDYSKTKTLLGVQNDYFINFTYTNASGIQQITINNTPLNNILDHAHVITRERFTLLKQNNKKIPIKIFLALYSN